MIITVLYQSYLFSKTSIKRTKYVLNALSLTLFRQMDFALKFDTVKSGLFTVNIEGSHYKLKKQQQYFMLRRLILS